MSKWTTNSRRIHDNSTGWCADCATEVEAERIAKRHNADCDAYETRIAALEAELKTKSKWLAEYQKQRDKAAVRLARIAELVRPVPVADLVKAVTDAPALLAERQRQIRAILEEEG